MPCGEHLQSCMTFHMKWRSKRRAPLVEPVEGADLVGEGSVRRSLRWHASRLESTSRRKNRKKSRSSRCTSSVSAHSPKVIFNWQFCVPTRVILAVTASRCQTSRTAWAAGGPERVKRDSMAKTCTFLQGPLTVLSQLILLCLA
jgi:hypothetical protein